MTTKTRWIQMSMIYLKFGLYGLFGFLYKKRYMIAFLGEGMLGPLPQHSFPKKCYHESVSSYPLLSLTISQ